MKYLRRLSRNWLLAGMLLAAAIIAILGPTTSERIRGAANSVLAPFGDGGMYLTTSLRQQAGYLGRRAISPVEARRLAEKIEELRGRTRVLEGEIARLLQEKELLGRLYGQMPYEQWEFIPARVVGADALPYGDTLVLNAGRKQGAVPGAAVTIRRLLTDRSKALPPGLATISSAATLVGRILDASAFTARLQLVTDKDFSIRAKILRVLDPDNPRMITATGAEAQETLLTPSNNPLIDVLATGDGAGGLVVEDVYAHEQVRPGDWLVTAGDDAFLPVQVYIGKVAEVTDDAKRRGLFVSLRVEPQADLAGLWRVYVVLPLAAGQQEVTP